MNILIIEDELKASRSLAIMINRIRPAARVAAEIQSIEGAVRYFSGNEMPDLDPYNDVTQPVFSCKQVIPGQF